MSDKRELAFGETSNSGPERERERQEQRFVLEDSSSSRHRPGRGGLNFLHDPRPIGGGLREPQSQAPVRRNSLKSRND